MKQKGFFTTENKGRTVSSMKTNVPHRLTIAHEGVNFYHLGRSWEKGSEKEIALVSKEDYYLTPIMENIPFDKKVK